MRNKLIGVLLGFSVSVAFGFVIGSFVNSDYARYSAVFIGGIVCALFAREKGWLYGGLVGVGMVIIIDLIIMRVAYKASHGQMIYAPETKILIPSLLTIVSASVGGLIGGLVRKK